MYATGLGATAQDTEQLRLTLFREVRDINQSIAANMKIQPPTPASVRAVQVMLPILRDRLTRLKQVTGSVNAAELTTFDRWVLDAGNYLAAAAKAGGNLASDFGTASAKALAPIIIAGIVGLAFVNKFTKA